MSSPLYVILILRGQQSDFNQQMWTRASDSPPWLQYQSEAR